MSWPTRHHLLAITIGWSLIAMPLAAEACKLVRAKSAKTAELVVYFTKFAKEDKTQGKYKACRIVRGDEPGAKPFFITPFRQDANVVVHRSNWPKS